MEKQPREHPAAEKAMRWLGQNWYVPIAAALTLEVIGRSHVPSATAPEKPAIEQPKPSMDMEK